MAARGLVRAVNEAAFGIDRRRHLPRFQSRTLRQLSPPVQDCDVILFADTFTNHYEPSIGLAALDVLAAVGARPGLVRHYCCGRPQISNGLLEQARALAVRNAIDLFPHADAGRTIVFCEPSCLSAVREDAPSLLRGRARDQAEAVARASVLFEEFIDRASGRLLLKPGPRRILFHGHCHQKAMGLTAPALSLLSKIPGATVVDLDAGCCGMAGSFGYARKHYDVSRAIGERKLLPAARDAGAGAVVVAAGTSCRHQVRDFAGKEAVHPAVLLQQLLGAT
jgi:Fe-S oxidoreductase